MNPKHWMVIAILSCAANGIGVAQQANEGKAGDGSERAVASATVGGRVFLDDTKAPCHKAKVQLKPVGSLQSDVAQSRNGGHDQAVTIEIGAQFDGSYLFTHVAAGSYYVVASCAGYISPSLELSLAESGSPGPLSVEERTARNKILESFARVDVQSNLPTSMDVVLERGGAISGTITFDDGEPAAGVLVVPMVRVMRNGREDWKRIEVGASQFMIPVTTDDRGGYRLSGLPAGKYAIVATLRFEDTKEFITTFGSSGYTSNAHSASLDIYSGNTPHKKAAHAFLVHAREERTGEDVVIPISKFHTIRGNLVSAQDGHVLNSGEVTLLSVADQSFAGSDRLTEESTGFVLSFVFEGDYVLNVPMAADVDYVPSPRNPDALGPPQYKSKVLHSYGSTSMPLHVDGDMDGVIIKVQEPNAKEAGIYKDEMRQQEKQNAGPR